MARQESLGALGGGAALESAFAGYWGYKGQPPTGLLKPCLDGIAVLRNLCQIKNHGRIGDAQGITAS